MPNPVLAQAPVLRAYRHPVRTPSLLLRWDAPRAAVALVVWSLAPLALAEGFRSPTLGSQGLGFSGVRSVFTDDASSIAHNPANLVELTEWEASAEPTLVYHTARFESSDGTARTKDPWKLLPHVFVGGPISDRVSGGLGITVPYGLSVKWEDDGFFRYTAPHLVDLKTFNFNPTLAFRLSEHLQLGVGVDVMWSELDLRQYYPWAQVVGQPVPDGELRARGDGVGYSGNLAATWKPSDRHRFTGTFRAPMDVSYDGDFKASNNPLAGFATTTVDFATKIRFPTVIGVGYGFQLTDAVRLGVSGEWVQFSRFEELRLETPLSLPGVNSVVPQRWRDTFTVGVGGDWQFADGWTARLSYQYFQTPVPDETFSPTIPDANQNTITVGVGYRRGRHRLDAAYARVIYDDRNITSNQNPSYIGRYEISVDLISLAYGFRF
jgi:long-chain fatty acid transport protein